jgi:SAM-dependent methyltransferase
MDWEMTETGPVEPLAESAPLAWNEAPRRCDSSDAADTCMWYHRVWQYLRLLGIITSIRTNTGFLMRTFREGARSGNCHIVLVSATADYSMLAHLNHAYTQEGEPLHATVIDRCETSLFLNRWYADRYGVSLSTSRADVLEYATDEPFDMVCTHNLLARFDPESRRRLVSRWHALLRPGGLVITTQRVRPNSDEHRMTFYTEGEARELARRVAAAARTHPAVVVDADELGRAVYEYARRKGGYVIRANQEITDLFVEQGFDLRLADEGEGLAERARDRPSSTAGKDTYRLRIIARKR